MLRWQVAMWLNQSMVGILRCRYELQVKSSDKKVRQAGTLEKEFWDPIFLNTDFKDFIKKQFTIGYKSDIDMDEILEMEV